MNKQMKSVVVYGSGIIASFAALQIMSKNNVPKNDKNDIGKIIISLFVGAISAGLILDGILRIEKSKEDKQSTSAK